jgi:hypothetical protein
MSRFAARLEDRADEAPFTARGERRRARLRALARFVRKVSRQPAR